MAAACIDIENYQVFAGFREPTIQIRGFGFNDADPSIASGVFVKDFSGLKFLGEVFEGRGSLLAVGTVGGTIHLWDTDSQKSKYIGFNLAGCVKLSGHLTAPREFAFDKRAKILVSGGDDTNIKVWDLRNPMVCK